MESVLADLVARCTKPRDTADALTAHRQLRSAIRRSAKAAEVAATSRYVTQLYDALRDNVDRTAAITSPRKSDSVSFDDTVIAEQVFTCLSLLEARVSVNAAIDDHVLDVASVMRTLASLSVTSLSSMCSIFAALNPVAPDTDAVAFAAVSLQCLYTLLAVITKGCRRESLWRAVLGELQSLDVASYLCEGLDMLATRLSYALRVASGSAASLSPVLVGATAVALRCCTKLYHATNAFDSPEHSSSLALQLTRRLLASDLIFKVSRVTAEESRIAVAAADAMIDCLALHKIASLPRPSSETSEAARAAATRLAIAGVSGKGCVNESVALCTAAFAAETFATGDELPIKYWIVDALSQGGGGMAPLSSAAGEWHCAVRWASHTLGKGSGPATMLTTVATGTTHDPVVLFSSAWNIASRSEEAQVKLVHRTATSRNLNGSAAASLHQWFAPPPPNNINTNCMYVATFGELFPKSGRVNHSKILRSSAYEVAGEITAPTAISSDAAPPPKLNTKHSGLYEMASGNLGRSSFITLSNQVGAIQHWRMDFGLQAPTVTNTNHAWASTFVVAVAVQSADVADVRIAVATDSHPEKQPLTARSARAVADSPRVEEATIPSVVKPDGLQSPHAEPTALESLLDEAEDATAAEVPPQETAKVVHTEPASSVPVDPLQHASKEDLLLLETVALRRQLDEVTQQRDDLMRQCSTLRHELTLMETQVVQPMMTEITHLRQLCADYEAAMSAADVVLHQFGVSGDESLRGVQSLEKAVRRLYGELGLEL